MKFAVAAWSTALLGLAFAAGVHAGQPNVPDSIGGAMVRDTSKDQKATTGKAAGASSSAGSSTPGSDADKEQAFKRLDIDGDGSVSKAEAAGNGKLMNEFDSADKDHDGKLNRAEYDGLGGKPEVKARTKTRKVQAQ